MNDDRTSRCLDVLRTALGDDVARKASEKFCEAFIRPPPGTPLAPDGFPRLMRLVVELTPLPKAPAGWLDAKTAEIAALAAVESMRAPVVEYAGGGSFPGATDPLTPAEILRRKCAIETKARSEEYAAPIFGALARATEKSIRSHPDGAAGFYEPPVQYCWINQTFPIWVDPRELAAVAEHPRISLIDVPRVLEPQMKETSKVLGVPSYRKKTKHTGKGVKVAVIDSEVAQLTSVFQNRVSRRVDYTGEGWGHPGEHGTAVAGIIAADSSVAQGMAPGAVIFNYKVFTGDAVGDPLDSHVEMALQQALEDGAAIANCSWKTDASPNGQSREARACDAVWACGMAVVAAMGNKGADGVPGTLTCPADARGVIAVGATTRDGVDVPLYSGQGPSKGQKPCPDLVAPGGNDAVEIHSFPVGFPGSGSFGENGWGTSLAAAHVSGILALLLEGNPGLLPDDQRKLLKSICRKLGFWPTNAQGHGIPDLTKL